MKKISVTVGMPTYVSGKHLVEVLQSIYQKDNISHVDKIIVAIDGSKIDRRILPKIMHEKLEVVQFTSRAGQSQRINDIIARTKTDLLILTNDDVIFSTDAVRKVISEYLTTKSELISGAIYPMKPKTLLETILKASTDIKHTVIRSIPNTQTYLTTNGRFICLSRRLYKNFVLPKNIINSDAYVYFYVIANKLKRSYIDSILCYYREPSTLSEHINQVYKFQMSYSENSKYFSKRFLEPKYKIKKSLLLKANLTELIKNPIYVSLYVFVYIYVRAIISVGFHDVNYTESGYWKTDLSTKSI